MESTAAPTTSGRASFTGSWRAPFTARAWRATAQIEVGMLLSLVTGSTVWVLTAAGATLALTLVLAAPVLAGLIGCARTFSLWHRSRIESFASGPPDRIDWPDPPTPPTRDGWWSRLGAQARSSSVWRQIGFHLASLVVLPAMGIVVSLWWCAALLGVTSAAYFWSLPSDVWGIAVTGIGAVVVATAFGVALLLSAAPIASSAARLDEALLRKAMAPSRGEALASRVAMLTETRSGAVAAADADRRRLERDLHDGTQQRLVSLAMNLGMTRTTLVDVPEHVRESVARAHEEAKLALAELRDLVRGLHPAVLDELGLDAAMTGIAARSTIPVRLMVDLPRRPGRAIEAAAYFLISEALTNAAKHSGASRVDVLVEPTPTGELQVIVSDDGCGAADPGRGTGLTGLAGRIGALDGVLTVHSPHGGPTVVTATLPYGSC